MRHFAALFRLPEPRGRLAPLAALGTGCLLATQPSSSRSSAKIAQIALVLFGELQTVSIAVGNLVARESGYPASNASTRRVIASSAC